MKWAIFEFEDSSCEVGQSSWIHGEDAHNFDNESWFFSNEIVVKWPKDFNKALKKMQRNLDVNIEEVQYERHSARVVKFGGMFNAIIVIVALKYFIQFIRQ